MKKLLYLFLLSFLLSCTQEGSYVLKGDYPGAQDGTVVYLSKYMVFDFDEMLAPIDSAVVKNGKFKFKGVADDLSVCLLSSSKIIDGGFVVLEGGDIKFTFNGAKCGGTLLNKELGRFMHEKEKIINIKNLSNPGMQKKMLLEPAMLDTINELTTYATRIFDSYAMNLIRKNAKNKLGHFFLTQSAGVVSPGRLLPLFPLIPNEYRDKIYAGKKAQVEEEMKEGVDIAKYALEAQEIATETSVGKMYKNFELNSIAGDKVVFSDELESGKYTMLLFWAAWDYRSVEFAKEISLACYKYNKKDLNIVTVSLDDNVDECAETTTLLALPGTHLCNPSQGSAELASAYGVYDLPVCLLINKKGVIISRTSSVDDIKNKLKEILP